MKKKSLDLEELLKTSAEIAFGDAAEGMRADKVLGFASDGLVFDNPARVSTGCDLLDKYLCGGIPLGRVTEIFGDPSKGKSTLLAHLYANLQKMGGVAVHLLSEEEMDSARWARIGVDLDRLIILPIDILEKGFEVICNVARRAGAMNVPSLIGWDTMNAAEPMANRIARDKEDPKLRYAEGMMSKFKKIREELGFAQHNLARHNCGLIIVQQSMQSPNAYTKTESGGGGGPKFFASLRLYLYKGQHVEIEVGKPGIVTELEIRKSKVCPPFRKIQFAIDAVNGIDNDYSMYNFLVSFKNICVYEDNRGYYNILDRAGKPMVKNFRWADWRTTLNTTEGLRDYIKERAMELCI